MVVTKGDGGVGGEFRCRFTFLHCVFSNDSCLGGCKVTLVKIQVCDKGRWWCFSPLSIFKYSSEDEDEWL